MKIFITGGAGYLGRAVVREFAGRGHEVVALVRTAAQEETVTRLGGLAVRGDLRAPGTYERPAAAAEAIVHLASPPDPDVCRLALDTLLASARHGRAPHVIYTSVLFVLGDVPSGADESAPATGTLYAHRAMLERLALDADASVIRPAMVFGGGQGGTISELFSSGLDGAVRYVGSGENRWSLVHRDDVAALFRIVATQRAAGIFHASDGSPMRVKDVARTVAAVIGDGTRVESISADDARPVLGAFADALCLDQPVSAERARALGWRPRGSFADRARAALEEFSLHTSARPVN